MEGRKINRIEERVKSHTMAEVKRVYRAGMVKVYLEDMGMTYSQIAEKMGIPESSVRVIAVRVRLKAFD